MRTIGRANADAMFLQGQRVIMHTQSQVAETSQVSATNTLGAVYLPLSVIPDGFKAPLFCRGAVYSRDGNGTAVLRARYGNKGTASLSVTASSYTAVETVVDVVGLGEDTAYFELVGDAATAFVSSASLGLYLEVA